MVPSELQILLSQVKRRRIPKVAPANFLVQSFKPMFFWNMLLCALVCEENPLMFFIVFLSMGHFVSRLVERSAISRSQSTTDCHS